MVESAFTRTLADGRLIEGTTVLAQRPPDRLEVGLGSVEGRVDGRRVERDAAGQRAALFPGR